MDHVLARHTRSGEGRKTQRGKLQKLLRKLSWQEQLQLGMPNRRLRPQSGWARLVWRSKDKKQMINKRDR